MQYNALNNLQSINNAISNPIKASSVNFASNFEPQNFSEAAPADLAAPLLLYRNTPQDTETS